MLHGLPPELTVKPTRAVGPSGETSTSDIINEHDSRSLGAGCCGNIYLIAFFRTLSLETAVPPADLLPSCASR